MPTVYIVNKSSHDYSNAERFGDFVYVTGEDYLNRYNINHMHRLAKLALKDSKPDDLLLLSGLNHLNSVVCSTFATMHGKLNLLLFKADGTYAKRSIVM